MPESKYSKQQKTTPACELEPNASCPPTSNTDEQQKQLSDKGSGIGKDGMKFRYWHLIAALIVTGAGVYKVVSIK